MPENTSPPTAVLLRNEDNVAVCCCDLPAGSSLSVGDAALSLKDKIPLGHKVSTRLISEGEEIRKYGQVIGFASADIPPGSHVHVHNCEADSFDRDYAFASEKPELPPARNESTFQGYTRADGRVGTRNYLAVISTVNCSASTSKYICNGMPAGVLDQYPNVDGFLPLTHKGGCGMQEGGSDHEQLSRVLAGFATHPNIGGYILVGLGCEVGQASHLVHSKNLIQVEGLSEEDRPAEPKAPPMISIQDEGGVSATVKSGIRAVLDLLPSVNAIERSTQPLSSLVLGTQCGGSDGSSGITANPALGGASDILVASGGTVILGETPEIYGAEHLLTRRAVSREVGEKLIERIRWWEWYSATFGAELNNNPSPGNKAGGLTTIFEKSLGAIAKGGAAPLSDVLGYAEQVDCQGLVVMDTPGYDPVSLTGIVAGGANICIFTTGRGSVYGCKPSPCIKVATNSPMYDRMSDDMDIDAGGILAGRSMSDVTEEIFNEILEVASGKKTASEKHGFGEEEFAPWSIGPVL
ncbi:MAG: altronate dehydratase family protein [Planctomycetota bacterium]|nr:altronate dehydratase family protein [Planctomycetota bacterium]